MAVELDTSNTGQLVGLSQDLPPGATRHFFNGNDDDSQTAKIIVIPPGAGKKLILTHLSLSTLTDQSISILDGSSAILLGPFQLEDTAGSSYIKDYKWGIDLTANTAMYVDSDSDVLFHIYIEYMIAPA